MSNILSKLISCKKSNFPNLKSQVHEQFRSESSKSCTKLPPTTRQQLRRATKHPAKPAAHTRESPFTSQLRGLHLCPAASASASAPASISAFCPCFHLCPLVPISTFAPSLRLCFYPCLHYRFRLPSLLSRPPSSPLPFAPPVLSSPRSRPFFALLRRRSIAKSRRLHPQETLA